MKFKRNPSARGGKVAAYLKARGVDEKDATYAELLAAHAESWRTQYSDLIAQTAALLESATQLKCDVGAAVVARGGAVAGAAAEPPLTHKTTATQFKATWKAASVEINRLAAVGGADGPPLMEELEPDLGAAEVVVVEGMSAAAAPFVPLKAQLEAFGKPATAMRYDDDFRMEVKARCLWPCMPKAVLAAAVDRTKRPFNYAEEMRKRELLEAAYANLPVKGREGKGRDDARGGQKGGKGGKQGKGDRDRAKKWQQPQHAQHGSWRDSHDNGGWRQQGGWQPQQRAQDGRKNTRTPPKERSIVEKKAPGGGGGGKGARSRGNSPQQRGGGMDYTYMPHSAGGRTPKRDRATAADDDLVAAPAAGEDEEETVAQKERRLRREAAAQARKDVLQKEHAQRQEEFRVAEAAKDAIEVSDMPNIRKRFGEAADGEAETDEQQARRLKREAAAAARRAQLEQQHEDHQREQQEAVAAVRDEIDDMPVIKKRAKPPPPLPEPAAPPAADDYGWSD